MTARDRLLGITVAVLWGLNFLAIHVGLEHFPPFFFTALRFLVIAIPVVLFVKPPKVPFRWLLLYGLGFGTAQFGLLFWAMNLGMPTGLASLVMQSSVPMTVVLSAVLLRENLTRRRVIGVAVAIVGIGLIGWDQINNAAFLPLGLTLLAALGWAFGNIGSRLANTDSPMRLMLWMTTVPPIPMLLISFWIEGPQVGIDSVRTIFSSTGIPALYGLAYIVFASTIIATGMWTSLLARNPANVVAPLSLFVPVVGLTAAWVFLGERPSTAALLGAIVVVIGCAYGISENRNPKPPPNSLLPSDAEPDALPPRTNSHPVISKFKSAGSELCSRLRPAQSCGPIHSP